MKSTLTRTVCAIVTQHQRYSCSDHLLLSPHLSYQELQTVTVTESEGIRAIWDGRWHSCLPHPALPRTRSQRSQF